MNLTVSDVQTVTRLKEDTVRSRHTTTERIVLGTISALAIPKHR